MNERDLTHMTRDLELERVEELCRRIKSGIYLGSFPDIVRAATALNKIIAHRTKIFGLSA